MGHSLFSDNMKLSDLVLANFRLLYVFPRFGIELGFGESTVKSICRQNEISIPLFLLVCNIYTFRDYLPSKNALNEIPVSDLITYLKQSHQDYLENRIPLIKNEILKLTQCCHKEMFEQFCDKYINDVIAHFNYEEKVVFPYINTLLQGHKTNNYSIEEFEKNHSNIEESLTDLKNIIIKYLPNDCNFQNSRKVLVELFLLENDLSKHTLLEDRILVSLVERIEKGI